MLDHVAIRWPLARSRGGTSGELCATFLRIWPGGPTRKKLWRLPSPLKFGDELRDNRDTDPQTKVPFHWTEGASELALDKRHPGYTKFEVSPSGSACQAHTVRGEGSGSGTMPKASNLALRTGR